MKNLQNNKLLFFRGSVLLLLWWVVMGCQRNQVEELRVAQQFLDAYTKGNIDKAIAFTTPASHEALRTLKSDRTLLAYEWPDSSSILGLSAADTVRYLLFQDSIIDTLSLPLQKMDGKWLVHFERNDPVFVARSFLQAFHQGYFKTSARFVAPNALRDLELAAIYYQSWRGPEVTIQSVRYHPNREKALVSYREKGNTLVKNISLIKWKGMWRVSFSKQAQW